jgi:hypothetical protein
MGFLDARQYDITRHPAINSNLLACFCALAGLF